MWRSARGRRTAVVLAVVCGAVLAVAAGLAWLGGGPARTIRIATEGAFPPFNYVGKDGRLEGFDVDIAKALCARMRTDCVILAQDWDGIVTGLLAGKYDAIVSSMAVTAARREQVAFTDDYYDYQGAERFVARKGAAIAITPAGLAGKRVGVQRATVHERFLRANFPAAIPVLYDNQQTADLDMAAGKLDLLLSNSVALEAGFLDRPAGRGFAFAGPGLADPQIIGGGAAIALRKDEGDLLAAFNRALAAIRADGTYKKVNDKYFAFDIGGK